MRWDILNRQEHMNPVARGSFAAEVAYLKEYITKRVEWMDKRLGYVHTDVQSPVTSSPLPIAIWDIMGRMVYTGSEMPMLENGLYVVQENGQTTIKLLNN